MGGRDTGRSTSYCTGQGNAVELGSHIQLSQVYGQQYSTIMVAGDGTCIHCTNRKRGRSAVGLLIKLLELITKQHNICRFRRCHTVKDVSFIGKRRSKPVKAVCLAFFPYDLDQTAAETFGLDATKAHHLAAA